MRSTPSTIQALPVEGDIPDLLSLQPGVLYLGLHNDQSHDSRSGSTAGARSDQNNSTLDGLDNNDQVRGYAFTGVLRSTLDSVQEFRVTTAGFNADTGRSSGAQINILTKSGTNEFHGSVYGRTRNLITPANDWFNKQAELAQGLPNVPGTLDRNTYGASLGGPIKKNKLFFFTTYEGEKINENQQMTMIVPTASLRAGQMRYPHTRKRHARRSSRLNPAQIASHGSQLQRQRNLSLGTGRGSQFARRLQPISVAQRLLCRRRSEYRVLHLVGARPATLEHLHREARLRAVQPQLAVRSRQSAERQRAGRAAVSRPARQFQQSAITARDIAVGVHLYALAQPDEQPALQLRSPELRQLRHRAGLVREFLRHEPHRGRDPDHDRRCAGAEPGRRSDLDAWPPHASVRRATIG